jgi:hypothetical protein
MTLAFLPTLELTPHVWNLTFLISQIPRQRCGSPTV